MEQAKRLKALEKKNSRLKRLVAELTLDKQILTDVVKKSFEAGETSGTNALDGRLYPVSESGTHRAES